MKCEFVISKKSKSLSAFTLSREITQSRSNLNYDYQQVLCKNWKQWNVSDNKAHAPRKFMQPNYITFQILCSGGIAFIKIIEILNVKRKHSNNKKKMMWTIKKNWNLFTFPSKHYTKSTICTSSRFSFSCLLFFRVLRFIFIDNATTDYLMCH